MKTKKKIAQRYVAPLVNVGFTETAYPESWTDYMTVAQVVSALSDPMVVGSDLTNIRKVKIESGLIRVNLDY